MTRLASNLSDWVTRSGSFTIGLGAGRQRGVVVTQDGNVFARNEEHNVLLFSGAGRFEFDFVSTGPAELCVVTPDHDTWSSVFLREWHTAKGVAGWTDAPSMAQLEPKSRDSVPPEVKKLFDAMNRNAMVREAKLREAIAALQGR